MENKNIMQAKVSQFLKRRHQLFIDGRWQDAVSGKTFPVHNPASGMEIANVAEGGPEDIDLAVAAARRAFEGSWAATTPSQRARLMWKLGDLIDKNAEELAYIESLDNGKTVSSAMKVDVPDAAERFRYFAGWATKIAGESLNSVGPVNWHAYTLREPVGVAGLIVAWNFPLFQAANKIAPALAAGCTVVLKPAEQTPLTALRLAELAQEAGFPEGVINVVTGYGRVAGAALTAHPDVDKISFTGSTSVGKMVLDAAKGNLKRVTLELGGKSPAIIMPDADLDRAIPAVATSIFFNSGQVCSAGSNLFVHKSVHDQVIEGIVNHAKKLKVGAGTEPGTELGPVVSEAQLERILDYCEGGVKAGAEIVMGGARIARDGFFVEPTVLARTTRDMAVRQEEIFGPVLATSSFDELDLDKIVDEANATIYGLAAYVWCKDIGIAHRLARRLKSGLVNINGGMRDASVPSGGYKQSGWGREHGKVGVEAFTEIKSIVVGL
ncbi:MULTISPECIES: aldehyde dehydrogenase family protein [unclassified Chelatococcus]|uniref:aldehyde dehydrogenase family protein n=1 Tax=unclassified Chelatococcus TaxID=2638111 RepID=UPI001BCEFCC2|nr:MULTISPECIES: aldehyde dehydrogenase family protein [unclassified Chelatococcus]MBS7697455.1 aldehyde dehydrogenase family protein [Chelatococcus sp. YT9]MBX3559234.1 aldehyde dehydrogenase family protein [Chelatococcus sp.]